MKAQDFSTLVDTMEAFLRVPKVSWREWNELDPDTKTALLVAAKRIELERILLAARALGGTEGRLEVGRTLDGGASWVQHCVSHAVEGYLQRGAESTSGK